MTDIDFKIIGIIATVTLSAIASFIVSYRTTRQELAKVPYEIQKNYAAKLQEKRIEIYPLFYYLLSDLIKRIDRRSIDKEYLKEWLSNYLDIDSKHSLVLSGATANENFRFYMYMEQLIKKYCDDGRALDEQFYKEIIAAETGLVETHLKKDIGIYIVEFDPKTGKRAIDPNDVDRFYGEQNV